ncbi:fumarylacetoacetate hydrolase family protein [Streptomyces sp. NPDC007205]|uniref:fumarylacetoacetate hydrolase family protein n=1 Tax=Streptomyces sp. NPDC007205 TaxID=3154316 RepID=UPI0033C8ED02
MRIANLKGRLVLVDASEDAYDVQELTSGQFGPDPQAVYGRWPEFRDAVARIDLHDHDAVAFDRADLGAPVPAPRQIFAIGLNYLDHAAESGFTPPEAPVVFTKFQNCLTGPHGAITLPAEGKVDWEAEIVAVIGRHARNVAESQAWHYVAGLTVGQDLSERMMQLTGQPPQFSLGKSFPGFGPMGPWVVSVDEFDDPDDIEIECFLNGEPVQRSRTRNLIFSIPELIARLSAVLPLEPGDIIFTGTPAGVGFGRTPQRWLTAGDELVSSVRGIGELRHTFVTSG